MELAILIIIPIAWVLLRKVNLWYWRLDERIAQQKETNRLLRKIAGEPDTEQTGQAHHNNEGDTNQPQSESERIARYNRKLYGE